MCDLSFHPEGRYLLSSYRGRGGGARAFVVKALGQWMPVHDIRIALVIRYGYTTSEYTIHMIEMGPKADVQIGLLRKRARLVPALQAKGCVVLQADAPQEAASGIVSFTQPGGDLAALHQKLLDTGIITSLRAG